MEVGLDLLAFPTILVYEIIFSTTRWRQAIRRSWRPGQTQEVRVIQLTYEQTMEARGLTLIATKAISSLMVEGKMPSAALNEHAQNSATTNLIMELYEQIVSEVEDASHEDHDENQCDATAETEGRTTERSSVIEALRTTFLALNYVEQESEQYIGAIDLTEEDEEEDTESADAGAYGEGAQFAQDTQPLDTPGPQDAPSNNDLHLAAVLGQVSMADLWSAPINVSNVSSTTLGNTVRTQTSDEAPRQSAIPVESSQRHVSWEEMRAQLQLEAAARRAKRRRGATAKSGASVPEDSGLWAMPSTSLPSEGGAKLAGSPQEVASSASLQTTSDLPKQELPCTSLSPERANADANSVSHVQQAAEMLVVEENRGECASKEADDATIGGIVGQLSLFD